MLKLVLASCIALYVAIPTVVGAMFAEFPEDGFGLRGCCRPCAMGFIGDLVVVGAIAGLVYFGVRELNKK